MTSHDIYNQSVDASNALTAFLVKSKFSPLEIVGALLVNVTSIEHEGKPIKEEMLLSLIKDFIALREIRLGRENGK
jgi:uncharacterized protein Yka (UPF0111/DUF47 family)